MRHFKLIISVWLLFLVINSCKEDQLSPVENDGTAPSPITNPMVENLSGAAKITYSLPSDKDLLYVKASYTNKKGTTYEVKASYYTNSLTIEGFADTSVYLVNLYAVDRSGNESNAVAIDVKPLTPPVTIVKESMTIKSAFGGINIRTVNSSKADLAIVISAKDSLGFFVTRETYYTKLDSIDYTLRGMDAVPTDFAIYTRDRWNNCSDTVFETLTPIYEKQLDKSKFKTVTLPNDASLGWGRTVSMLWDGYSDSDWYIWHSGDDGCPMWITFDLGVTAKLSRFTLWQRTGDTYIYNHGNPKVYEIWGATNPGADGNWDNWTKLNHCISVKPSGYPIGSITDDDTAAAAAGESWDVPLDAPDVRYIRVKVISTWSGGVAAHIAEMTFWGNDQ
jgi:hypothetical protein